jgi:hypothetical protein
MNEKPFTAVFYDYTITGSLTTDVDSEEKFIELCEMFPTKWAHLMNTETGEVVYSWSNEATSWSNN